MVEFIIGGIIVVGNTLRTWEPEPRTKDGRVDWAMKLLLTVAVVVIAEIIWAYVWDANH